MRKFIHRYAEPTGLILGCNIGVLTFIHLQRKKDCAFLQNQKFGDPVPATDHRPFFIGQSIAWGVTAFGMAIGWLTGP